MSAHNITQIEKVTLGPSILNSQHAHVGVSPLSLLSFNHDKRKSTNYLRMQHKLTAVVAVCARPAGSNEKGS
jgi:hypothetical protein